MAKLAYSESNVQLWHGDARDMSFLADGSVHCAVCSPPYWSLRKYGEGAEMVWGGDKECQHQWSSDDRLLHAGRGDAQKSAKYSEQETIPDSPISSAFCQLCGAWRGQLGLEPDIDLYISHLMEIVDEVWRVLREDGVFWINLADSYASSSGIAKSSWDTFANYRSDGGAGKKPDGMESAYRDFHGLKPKDLCNIPHRVAAEMQRRGWYWRSTIVWAKGRDGDDELYETIGPGSSMPDSVNGWRWERCRVKVGGKGTKGPTPSGWDTQHDSDPAQGRYDNIGANLEWQDCPGCPKCLPHDGYVLRKGSWRPAKAHEYLFLTAKGQMNYGDDDAVRVEWPGGSHRLRDVWFINTKSYKGSHFATFAPALVERCIKAATSERGVCPACGSQWARVVERKRVNPQTGQTIEGWWGDGADPANQHRGGFNAIRPETRSQTIGWRPSCDCHEAKEQPSDFPRFAPGWYLDNPHAIPARATVLDPFVGSGTTIQVARQLGRRGIGVECVEDYIRLAIERLGGPYEVETEDGVIVKQEQLW